MGRDLPADREGLLPPEEGSDTAPPPTPPLNGAPPPPPIEPPIEDVPPSPPPEERWLLARVTEPTRSEHRLINAFRSGAIHEIAVAIGPEQQGALVARGRETFDEALGPEGQGEQLFVAFLPPLYISPPQTGSLFLPPTGTSRWCPFTVKLPTDLATFEALIQVSCKARIIQVARLHGPVVADPDQAAAGSRIRLELTVLRPATAELTSSSTFDASLIRSSSTRYLPVTTAAEADDPVAAPSGLPPLPPQPMTTALREEELVPFNEADVQRAVPKLTDLLTKLATGAAARRGRLDHPEAVAALRALAFQGRELYSAIGQPLDDRLGVHGLRRLQVLNIDTQGDFFPIELVYDLPAPTTHAPLCPGWKTALTEGACPESHRPTGPRGLAPFVCPLGFWALSKVIERQAVHRDAWTQPGSDIAVRVHPTAQRRALGAPTPALFAASARVDRFKTGQIAAVLRTLRLIAERAPFARTWNGWVQAVRRTNPSLLVLLSHTTEVQHQAALEIGEADPCLLSQLNAAYVRCSEKSRPIVLLLGCDTAVADQELHTFVAKFQDLGAALVIGTTGSVLGERAARVARSIARQLAKASKGARPIPAGDLLLAIRRQLLSRGELTALCLTAYGDADWQLGTAA
jgi:hypothetical protein